MYCQKYVLMQSRHQVKLIFTEIFDLTEDEVIEHNIIAWNEDPCFTYRRQLKFRYTWLVLLCLFPNIFCAYCFPYQPLNIDTPRFLFSFLLITVRVVQSLIVCVMLQKCMYIIVCLILCIVNPPHNCGLWLPHWRRFPLYNYQLIDAKLHCNVLLFTM